MALLKARDLLYRRVRPVLRLQTNILFVSIDDDDASILHHHHRWLQLSMGETMLKIELIKNKRDYCCSIYNRSITLLLSYLITISIRCGHRRQRPDPGVDDSIIVDHRCGLIS